MLVASAVTLLTGPAAFAEPPDALKPYSFLIGEWRPVGSGEPGAGAGTAVFSRGLQDRVIVRTSYAEYPAGNGKPASRHDDLMIIFAGADGSVRADYYDNEGHVIRYSIRSPAPGEAVFVSDASASGPRYRLGYKLDPSGLLKGEFAIAPPGQPEAFKTYLTWESRKTS